MIHLLFFVKFLFPLPCLRYYNVHFRVKSSSKTSSVALKTHKMIPILLFVEFPIFLSPLSIYPNFHSGKKLMSKTSLATLEIYKMIHLQFFVKFIFPLPFPRYYNFHCRVRSRLLFSSSSFIQVPQFWI